MAEEQSFEDRAQQVRGAFYAAAEMPGAVMPNDPWIENGDVYEDHIVVTSGPDKWKVGYADTVEGGIFFDQFPEWVKVEKVLVEARRFLFAEVREGKPVEFLRVGTFEDGLGRELEITAEDMDAYIANFESRAAEQDIPVDVDHRYEESAGWVKRVWRDGTSLLAEIDWSELGNTLIGGKIYRYVSASLDVVDKILVSISLTNFPAIKGMAPVELSEGIYRLEVAPGFVARVRDHVVAAINAAFNSGSEAELAESNTEATDMSEKDKEQEMAELREQMRAEIVAETVAKMAEHNAELAELREQVRSEVEAEMTEKFERRQGLVEFAEEICNGDAGLSAKPEDVAAFLEGLNEAQVEQGKAILRAKVVSFGELGSERNGNGDLKKLPAHMITEARARGEGIELSEWWGVVAQDELGDMAGYDVSEFTKEA